MSVLSLHNIHRSFGAPRPALSGVSLTVNAGEVLGLIGKNGAGKSTLLKVAMALLHADQGSVQVFGLDPWRHWVEVKRRIGFVPEDESAFVRTQIRQLLDLHAALYPGWDARLAERLLGPLARHTGERLDRLSKGQVRRLLLTCALAHRPELLVLDEPGSGLDPSSRREFLELAVELLNDSGSTIVFSSHHMGDIERIATRVVVLDQGEAVLDEALDTLKEEYCVALLPALERPALEVLATQPGFVRYRARGATSSAVFKQAPEAAAVQIRQALGLGDVRCTRVGLEEFFINLVGGES
jgi:ABC-2 type transport system ATP-binding protein